MEWNAHSLSCVQLFATARLLCPWDSPGKNTQEGSHFLLQGIFPNLELNLGCPTLCDPIDSSPPGSSIHGIFQARVLEWGAIEVV